MKPVINVQPDDWLKREKATNTEEQEEIPPPLFSSSSSPLTVEILSSSGSLTKNGAERWKA